MNKEIFIKIQNETLNADEIEIFNLISFRQLLLQKFSKRKDFLIAKVSSIKEEDSDSIINSYYCANQLNKYLFKYEPERRLLHRMRVRNPINNIYILDTVVYFKVTYNENILKEIDRTDSNNTFNKEDSDERNEPFSNTSSLEQESLLDEDFIRKKDNTIILKSKYFGTEDDFLTNKNIRQYFKKNLETDDEEFLFQLSRENRGIIELLQTLTNSEDNPERSWMSGFVQIHTTMISILSFLLLFFVHFEEIRILLGVLLCLFILSFISIFVYFFCVRNGTLETLNSRGNVEI